MSYPNQLKNLQNTIGGLAANTSFLILNTIAGSGLGFVFWIVATHRFDSAHVGMGAAYLSAITLLAAIGEMGLGTTLIRFAPSMQSNTLHHFVNASATVVTTSTLLIALAFVVGASFWARELEPLSHSFQQASLFIIVLIAFSLAQFLDRLYVAFQRTHFLFIRTLLANILRILTIVFASYSLGATIILLAVGIGALISLIISIKFLAPRSMPAYRFYPTFELASLRSKITYSLSNHLSLLLWNAPPLIYPLIIVQLLGAASNAYFYICWMMANILFVVPTALSTAVFAQASNRKTPEQTNVWYIMYLAVIGLVPVVVILASFSSSLLSVFGSEYSSAGRPLLTVLLLSSLPYTVNSFATLDCRIRQDISGILWISGFITLLSLILVVVGGILYGLVGVGIGWIAGQTIGVFYVWLYYRYVRIDFVSLLFSPFALNTRFKE
ncbi:oligosaccharide flippase family protein [Chloroflexi bacterium TSY]|nr:oligosaccharide flippase family protein [Chloroflexi bacterium TSY]